MKLQQKVDPKSILDFHIRTALHGKKTIRQGNNTTNGGIKSEETPSIKPQPFQPHLYRPSLSINNHHLLITDH